MYKLLAALLTICLVAAAFFLPEELSQWGDRQLLDKPNITRQDEEREGFAESVQMTVAEKLLLLRSGTANSMDLDGGVVSGLYPLSAAPGETAWGQTGLSVLIDVEQDTEAAELKALSEEEINVYREEISQLWRERVEAVRAEVHTLQVMGGLPTLWNVDSELAFTGYGDTLYLDTATQMSFQAYRMTLSAAPYALEMTVDVQSGRVLAFHLEWSGGEALNWGPRGASNFGPAWRDYWGLDSVGSGWYNNYNQAILEDALGQLRNNGDYGSHGQIAFTYDGQSIPVPLNGLGYSDRRFDLLWNIL